MSMNKWTLGSLSNRSMLLRFSVMLSWHSQILRYLLQNGLLVISQHATNHLISNEVIYWTERSWHIVMSIKIWYITNSRILVMYYTPGDFSLTLCKYMVPGWDGTAVTLVYLPSECKYVSHIASRTVLSCHHCTQRKSFKYICVCEWKPLSPFLCALQTPASGFTKAG